MVWDELPSQVQRRVEIFAGGAVVAAESCSGGFSPGLASRLTLAAGGRVFCKAINRDWPIEAEFHRTEAWVAMQLPADAPAPRLWGWFDDGDWVALILDDVDGEPVKFPV